jgi:hypothetical protein
MQTMSVFVFKNYPRTMWISGEGKRADHGNLAKTKFSAGGKVQKMSPKSFLKTLVTYVRDATAKQRSLILF